MNVSRVGFTGLENKNNNASKDVTQRQSALYSKQGYMDMLRVNRFMGGAFLGYGMFETIDKLALVKNKKNLAKDALIAQAKKGTKRNILIGLAVGALALVVGHFTDKKLIPFNERMYDKLEAQEKELQEFEEFKKQRDAQKPAAEVVNNVEGETSVEKKD